jgi:phage-related protein
MIERRRIYSSLMQLQLEKEQESLLALSVMQQNREKRESCKNMREIKGIDREMRKYYEERMLMFLYRILNG